MLESAPRNADSTRCGAAAKLVSPSRDAKTAPPMRAAPQSPVRIVPLNHCTETRRRSTRPPLLPSTDSGGSLPSSTGSATNFRPPARGLPWSKTTSPALGSRPPHRTFRRSASALRSPPESAGKSGLTSSDDKMLSAALRSLIATGPSMLNVQLTLSRPHIATCPRHDGAPGRRRIVAVVRRRHLRTARIRHALVRLSQLAKGRQGIASFPRSAWEFFAPEPLTMAGSRSLYKPPWRAAAWRDGASAKPLTVFAVNSSGHELWPCRMHGHRRLRLLPEEWC